VVETIILSIDPCIFFFGPPHIRSSTFDSAHWEVSHTHIHTNEISSVLWKWDVMYVNVMYDHLIHHVYKLQNLRQWYLTPHVIQILMTKKAIKKKKSNGDVQYYQECCDKTLKKKKCEYLKMIFFLLPILFWFYKKRK